MPEHEARYIMPKGMMLTGCIMFPPASWHPIHVWLNNVAPLWISIVWAIETVEQETKKIEILATKTFITTSSRLEHANNEFNNFKPIYHLLLAINQNPEYGDLVYYSNSILEYMLIDYLAIMLFIFPLELGFSHMFFLINNAKKKNS